MHENCLYNQSSSLNINRVTCFKVIEKAFKQKTSHESQFVSTPICRFSVKIWFIYSLAMNCWFGASLCALISCDKANKKISLANKLSSRNRGQEKNLNWLFHSLWMVLIFLRSVIKFLGFKIKRLTWSKTHCTYPHSLGESTKWT